MCVCVCIYIYIYICFCEIWEFESSHRSEMYMPIPNFISISRLMLPHIYQENMKMIVTHIMSYASKIELGQKKEK